VTDEQIAQKQKELQQLADGGLVILLAMFSVGAMFFFIYALITWDSTYASLGVVLVLLIAYLLLDKAQQEKGECYRCDRQNRKP
jgi:hypothetical protein